MTSGDASGDAPDGPALRVLAVTAEPAERGCPVEKAVLGTRDALAVECVRIPRGDRRESICLSTQAGCRMACRFCETARSGLARDLTAAEITGQVAIARAELDWRPERVVFQGMGEPLDNFDALADALRALTGPAFGFAHDRLTVCTAGHVDGIARLTGLGMRRLELAVSLNAVDDALRRELMPIAARWTLRELQAAIAAARRRKNQQIGIHYCLLPGINDRRQDAHGIAAFCAPLGRTLVHLIPYNPGSAPLTRAPGPAEIDRFVGWLREHGVRVRRRLTKGRSLMAACGQLGGRASNSRAAFL